MQMAKVIARGNLHTLPVETARALAKYAAGKGSARYNVRFPPRELSGMYGLREAGADDATLTG
jgi:hypothetical protein